MLSLVLGTAITDASVAAIAASYSKLELLDLSGYVTMLLPIFHIFESLIVKISSYESKYLLHNAWRTDYVV